MKEKLVGKRESSIQTSTVARIEEIFGPRVVVRVKHGTAYATAGDPDIYGCLSRPALEVRGRMFAFEIKNEDGRLTKIQQHRLKEYDRAGAITGAIRDPEEAITIIRKGVRQ